MKTPRIKLYQKTDGFRVYIVDGSYIRKNMNDQFTNFAQHYRFPKMIPVKEFWLDQEFSNPKEYQYFIDHLKKEWELMRQGKPYSKAIVEADDVEWNERNKDENKQYKIEKLDDINGVSVWLVDGNKVRSDCYIDFTEGGHSRVYDFVPEGEIWIDSALSKKERPYVLAHEYDEYVKMGQGETYNKAHNQASFFERHLRHKIPNLTMKKTRQKGKERSIIPILSKVK